MSNVSSQFSSLNTFKASVRDDVLSIMSNYTDEQLSEMDVNDIVEELQENHYTAEVIYYADAWEIVAGSAFNDYEAECLDFSNCDNSMECLMQEANQIIYSAYNSIAYEVAEEFHSEAIERYEESLNDDELDNLESE
ncbi:MAG: hypothetical protein KBT03_13050 [Bacteroidales bacterium]|nr:hypothetical protein [Candidatus Scybalousia scybalohippi]